MSVELVQQEQHPPPDGWTDLSGELVTLRAITAKLMDSANSPLSPGEFDKDLIDAVAKLVTAVTKLSEFRLKAESTITAKEVRQLVMSMGRVVNTHIEDRSIRSKIKREWLDLISGAMR